MSKIRAGPKSGRKQLREITRAGQKRVRYDDEATVADLTPDNESDSDNAEPSVAAEREDVEQHRGQAYNALLTLLKSEHPERKHKSNKKIKKDSQRAEEDSPENDGINSEDEQQNIENALDDVSGGVVDEEDMEDSLSDVDESEDESDPFESHFSKYSESRLYAFDKGFKDKTVKYKSSKTDVSEEESLIYSKPCLDDEEVLPVKGKQTLSSYFIKQKLKLANDFQNNGLPLTEIQKELVDPMFQYKDMLYEYDDYADEDQYRDLYSCLLYTSRCV